MINSYSFGQMGINGRTYASDLIIYPDGHVEDHWWREEGHALCEGDITYLIAAAPECIIVGTGAYGLLEAEPELVNLLADRQIELHILPTGDAMNLYNKLHKTQKVGACFHLTC